ncbi:MAG: signal peptidase II [Actinobacteria bacterium]|nr:signal peptidase II [Actinomycetota bacterium]
MTALDAPPAAMAGTGATRRRLAVTATAVTVAAVDLSAKAWAEAPLAAPIPLGPIDLRLAYNPGVAFSMGTSAPVWLVITVTGAVTIGVAVLAWRVAAGPARMRLAGLGLVLGGADANLIDRARDGVVTDYLHSGWFPTFNLADAAIVTGAGLLVLAAARHRSPHDGAGPSTLQGTELM